MFKKPTNYFLIYFSPHLDDVVLSCGGFLKKNYRKHQIVVNIFSGEYRGLTKWDLSCGIKNKKPIIIRKREDQRALRFVKARVIYLNFLDNSALTDLKKKIRPFSDSSKITVQIAQILNKNISSTETVIFPLGISHPDHLLISKIARTMVKELENKGIKVYFYEDFPYFIKNRFHFKNVLKNYTPLYFDISREIATKIKMVISYKSQLSSLFKILYPTMKLRKNIKNLWEKTLLNYHQDIAKQSGNKIAKYCERFWLLR